MGLRHTINSVYAFSLSHSFQLTPHLCTQTAMNTGDGLSYRNPAERKFSIVNVSMQGSTFARSKHDDNDIEKILKNCKNMAELRQFAVEFPDAKLPEAIRSVMQVRGCTYQCR